MNDKDIVSENSKAEFSSRIKEFFSNCSLKECNSCDACVKSCPATGLENMDPRKFVSKIFHGLYDEILSTPWVWMCSMCMGCTHVCPDRIEIAGMVALAREAWPEAKRPVGIVKSCNMALRHDTCSAMGVSSEDFRFIVEDLLEEVREEQKGWKDLGASIDRKGAFFFLNQNSREPVVEPDEMVPLWKIMHSAGADWTYGSRGWAAENYCMFAQDLKAWEQILRIKAGAVDDLECRVWLNTE